MENSDKKINIADKRINIIFKFLWFFSSLFLFGFTYYNYPENSIELNQIFGIILMSYSATIVLYLLNYILNEIQTFSMTNSVDNKEINSFSKADTLYSSIKCLIINLGIISLLLYCFFAYIYEYFGSSLFCKEISSEIHFIIGFDVFLLVFSNYINVKRLNIRFNHMLKCITFMFFVFIFFCYAFKISIVVNSIVNFCKMYIFYIILVCFLIIIIYNIENLRKLLQNIRRKHYGKNRTKSKNN